MSEEYDEARRLYLHRDDEGRVRSLRPAERLRATTAQLPRQAATEFLRDNAVVLGVDPAWLEHAAVSDGDEARTGLRVDTEKQVAGLTTVSYQQVYRGVPVWRRGMTVTLREDPARVVSVQSTVLPDVELDVEGPKRRPAAAGLVEKAIEKPAVRPVAEAERTTTEVARPQIVSDRVVIYRYDARRRFTDFPDDPGSKESPVPLPLAAPEPRSVQDGELRLAREIVFRIGSQSRGQVTWIVLLDVRTAEVLLLRPFLADVAGLVFTRDPMTAGGTAGPASTGGTLDAFRTSVTLPGLTSPAPGAEQELRGDNVTVSDFEAPTIAPPNEPTGTAFDYASRTNDFAAVNAYYHNDRFFRLVADLGFPRASYFDGTTFPLRVDHRGRFGSTNGIEINASCTGNGTGGILEVDYELADLGDTANPIGLATDWRVALHELGGHGILYDHVNWANLGFAHSVGDSFAAILSDPDTQAADRFLTYPWVAGVIARRHDRALGAGWAFGGTRDTGGYNTEQILATAHFRLYRSLGGDSSSLALRRFAAHMTAHLLLGAVGTLTTTSNPADADAWVTALGTADADGWPAAGHAGGAYAKVVRWSFEKQGLFQAPGAPSPVTTEGRPPAVDVYIDDGRHGEYQYQPVHWNNQNVWNRRYADNGTLHEDPWLGRENFAYCRVRNLGTQTATGVLVRAFHCNPGAGLTWPDDWQSMTTPQLAVADIPPGGEVTVGPFRWTPSQPDHECLLMIASATGDPSTVDVLDPGASIPEWRLVPHDNNIGQRNVHPVPAAGGVAGIVAVLDGRSFTVHNPFDDKAPVQIDVALPAVLERAGWKVRVSTPGGGRFGLPPRGERRVRLAVEPGEPVGPDAVRATDVRDVVVAVQVAGIPVGGMTYRLDPERAKPLPQDDDRRRPGTDPHDDLRDEHDDRSEDGGCATAASDLLECLHLPGHRVKGARVRTIGVDVEVC